MTRYLSFTLEQLETDLDNSAQNRSDRTAIEISGIASGVLYESGVATAVLWQGDRCLPIDATGLPSEVLRVASLLVSSADLKQTITVRGLYYRMPLPTGSMEIASCCLRSLEHRIEP